MSGMSAYFEDSTDTRPGQSDVDGVNIGDDVSYRLEFVQKPHDCVHLIGEVYLAAFVAPTPSLLRTSLLELPRITMDRVECSINIDGIPWQQSAYYLPALAVENLKGIREYAARIPCIRGA
jgi:hypothetical protein